MSWQIQGIANFNADGHADILWRQAFGQVTIWFMSGGQFIGDASPRAIDTSWQVRCLLRDQR